MPLSSHIRAPELAYLADLQSDEDEEEDNDDSNNNEGEDDEDGGTGKEDEEEESGADGDEKGDNSATVRKRSSGRTSKKPAKLTLEPASKQAFTGSFERLKHISNAKRKPSVAVKMYVPSFDVKPKVPTKMFGSRHRGSHSRKDEESATIHTLYCKYFFLVSYIYITIIHSFM